MVSVNGAERDRVGAEIHLAVAMADRQRRALARADHQIAVAREHETQRERAAQLRQRRLHRLDRADALERDSRRPDAARSRYRFRFVNSAPLLSSASRSSRKFSMMPLWTTATCSVACGCALFSVGLPWVAQRVWPMPVWPFERRFSSLRFEIFEFAFGAAAVEPIAFQRGDARGIVAAIFKALERIHQLLRDRSASQNADNAAHADQYPQIERKWPKRRGFLLTRIAERPDTQ